MAILTDAVRPCGNEPPLRNQRTVWNHGIMDEEGFNLAKLTTEPCSLEVSQSFIGQPGRDLGQNEILQGTKLEEQEMCRGLKRSELLFVWAMRMIALQLCGGACEKKVGILHQERKHSHHTRCSSHPQNVP